MYRDDNIKLIREEFGYLGFRGISEKEIADKIKIDPDKFQVAGEMQFLQYGIKEDLCYEIFLKKYERQNLYRPYMYQATLKDEPDKTMLFRISNDESLTIRDAFNLLNGRAVQKLVLDWSNRKMHSAWFQLDFGAHDVHGNFKLERLPLSNLDYVVSASLEKYPIIEMKYPEERTKLIFSLLRGNVEPVTLLIDGKEVKAFAEASPKNRDVHIYSEPGRSLMESKIKSRKMAERKSWKPPGERMRKIKRKGKSL